MKRISVALIALALSQAAFAQDVTYALPFTTIVLDVDVVKEFHTAGPYASYAKEMLNLAVPVKDEVVTTVSSISVRPVVEADPWSPRYSCPAGNNTFLEMTAQGLVSFRDNEEVSGASLRFAPQINREYSAAGVTGPNKQVNHVVYRNVRSDSSDVQYPVQQAVLLAKTPEDKAAAAAEMILNARQDRYNIAIGNTDASYSGGSLGAALDELTKIEKENLLLFTGYTTTGSEHYTFEVMPTPTARTHRYLAFYLTDDGNLTKDSRARGIPYEVEFTPVSIPDVATEPSLDPKKKSATAAFSVHYRIPAVCKVRLLRDGVSILETRIPVYQLGRETEMPVIIQ